MANLYDEDGNLIEGAATPEELKALQEKQAELEAKAAQAAELDAKLKEKEDELAKLSSKDLNFKRLREKSEAELDEVRKKMTEKEKLLLTEVMELTKEREEEKNRKFLETKTEVLDSLSNGDESLKKAIELAEKELAGEAKTPKELEDRFRKAYILAKGEAPTRNPLFSGYSSSYREPNLEAKKFDETDKGKESIKTWFPGIANKVIKN